MGDNMQKVKPYLRILPHIIHYQIATKAFIAVWIFLLGRLFQVLLKSSGRVAVTSGDYLFLFTTWQGLLILILGLVTLFVYVAFDLNSKIVLSARMFNGQKVSFLECIKEGFASIGKFFNLRGILVVLYIAFISPVLGIGISISLTEGFCIPTFIAVFIKSSTLLSVLAGIAALVFLSVGIAHLFILHGLLIDDLPMAEASRQSTRLIRENWKDYLKNNIIYILMIGAVVAGTSVLFLFIPLKLLSILSLPGGINRLLTVFFVVAGVLISILMGLLGTPLYILKMTQLYYFYTQGRDSIHQDEEDEKKGLNKRELILVAAAVIVITAIVSINFDRLFLHDTKVEIIAHRGGGNEGKENTVSGLETACELGAYGSEIDIQRTKDNYYVINHDGTFKRVTGDKRKPEEMTLSEVKKLTIDGEPVPTFEEMLEASKGRIILFTELKGNTADRKMADDAVRLVKKYKMEKECVLISLQYDVINYIESTYPEMQTGFLAFASIGKTAKLNCDYLGLEEDSLSADTIRSIHDEGKKVIVWTVNDRASQKYFLCTQVDGIITDNVRQAISIIPELEKRNDLDRMLDKIKTVF